MVVPDPPPEGTEAEAWLSSLIDGLGLSNVTVVACDGYCVAALERALLEPDRIARVILVCRGRGSEGVVDGSIDSTPRLTPVPILVLRRDRTAAEIVPLVRRFLDRTEDRATALK
jgi:pimeloyl-ACP methyl ester carboxylesterase